MPQSGKHTLGNRLQWPLAALLLVLCLVLGGGQGTIGDSACQALAAALIIMTLWRSETDASARLPRVAWLALLPLVLPLLQLLPVPDALWLSSPARVEIAAQLGSADVAPPARWSLVPFGTELSLAWLLPALAMFLSALQFSGRQRLRLVAVFIGVTVVAVVLGVAQLAAGPDSPLYFYSMTNNGAAVGFFANRNHLASQLVVALPFLALGTSTWWSLRQEADESALLGMVVGIGLSVLVILALALVQSRAGFLLGMLAIALVLPAMMGARRRRGAKRLVAISVAVGALLSIQFALFGVLQRLEADPLEDARFAYAGMTLEAARDYAPLGTGLGGFRRAFEMYDIESPMNVYINHAHNDYAELWLEGRWLFVLLALPLGVAFVIAAWRAWRRADAGTSERFLARAATISLLLLALHSLADYPLRTSALLAITGLLAALLSRPPSRSRSLQVPE